MTHLVKVEVVVYCLIAADVLLVGRGLAVKEVPTYDYCSLIQTIHVYSFLVVYYVCSCV